MLVLNVSMTCGEGVNRQPKDSLSLAPFLLITHPKAKPKTYRATMSTMTSWETLNSSARIGAAGDIMELPMEPVRLQWISIVAWH